ncbi:MAG: hypothetical protein ACTSVO_10480 [Candidatus Heimdallarchaeaceae archaeon]
MVVNTFDLIFVTAAVLTNLVVSAIYISIRKNAVNLIKKLGIVFLLSGIPIIAVLIGYIVIGYEYWVYVVLSYIIAFFVVQLLLDFVLKSQFREKTVQHTIYILFFYLFQTGLILVSFNINEVCGYIVSSSFWILLGALIYLYIGKRRDKKLKKETT